MPTSKKTVDNTSKNNHLSQGNQINAKEIIKLRRAKSWKNHDNNILPTKPVSSIIDKGYNNPTRDKAFCR